MNKSTAIQCLRTWDKRGKYVFSTHALQKCFAEDKPKAFRAGLERLVKDQLLLRACRGVYVNPHAISSDGYAIEHIAKALRPGEYNYVSLESILSEYGVISQIPMDRLTVMTTGRKGIYKTVFGGEFLKCWRSETHAGHYPYDPTQAIYLSFDENVNPIFRNNIYQLLGGGNLYL